MPRPITMDPEKPRSAHPMPRKDMLGAMEGMYRPSWEAGPPVGWGMTPEEQHESRMRQAERYQPLSTPLSPTAEYDSNTAGILLPLLAGQVGTKALEKVLRGKAAMGGHPPPGGGPPLPPPPASTPTSAMRAEIEKRGLPKTELVDDLPALPPVNPEQSKMMGFKYDGPDAAELARRYDDEWWANFAKNPPPAMRGGPEEPLPPLPPADPEIMRVLLERAKSTPPAPAGPKTAGPPHRRKP